MQKITTIDQFFMPNLVKLWSSIRIRRKVRGDKVFLREKYDVGVRSTMPFLGVQIVGTAQRDMWAAKKQQQPEGGFIHPGGGLSIPNVQPIRVRDILL